MQPTVLTLAILIAGIIEYLLRMAAGMLEDIYTMSELARTLAELRETYNLLTLIQPGLIGPAEGSSLPS